MAKLVRPSCNTASVRAWALAGLLLAGACRDGRSGGTAAAELPALPALSADLEAGLAELLSEPHAAAAAAPDDARTVAELGIAFEANRRLQEAARCYERAAALAPEEPGYTFHLAYVRERLGDWRGALELLRAAAESAADCAPLQHRLGVLELQTENLDAAERAFRRAVDAAPRSAEGHAGLGAVQSRRGLHRDAAHSLEQAVRLSPDYGSAWYRLGLAYRELGRAVEAESALARGVGAGDRVFAGPLHAALARYDATRIAVRRRTRAQLDEGRVDDALSAIDGLLERFPDDARGHVLRASVLAAAGRAADAAAALDAAEALRPGLVELHVERARQALDAGRADDALAAAQRAATVAPDVSAAHAALGRVRSGRGEHAEAVAAWRRAASLDPAEPAHRRELARALTDAGRGTEALAEYDALVLVVERSADLHLERARAAVVAGNVAEARSSLFLARTYGADEAALAAVEETLP